MGQLNPSMPLALGLAAAGAAISIVAAANLSVAVPAGTVGVVGAAIAGALVLGERVRMRQFTSQIPSGAPLVALASAFEGGRLGRLTVMSAIAGLERYRREIEPTRPDAAMERRLLSLPKPEFMEWVRARLARLEAET